MQAAARIGQKRHLKDKNKATKTCREKEIQNQNKNQSFPKETPVSKIVLLCRSSSYRCVWLEEQRHVLRKRKSQVASADGVGEVRLHV